MTQDPRIAQAYALLRQVVLERSQEDPRFDAGLGWDSDPRLDARRLMSEVMLTSATDLLVPWSPSLTGDPGGIPEPFLAPSETSWDSYLGPEDLGAGEYLGVGEPRAGDHEPSPIHAKAPPPRAAEAASFTPIELADESWFGRPDDALDDNAAAGAVDAFYGWMHAIGRRDVDEALAYISAAFHTMEGDQEVDFQIFEQRLRAFVDERSKGALEVALSRIPEPLAAPLHQGRCALMEVHLQIDFWPASDDPSQLPKTDLIHALALLAEEAAEQDGAEPTWRLRSFSRLDR